MMRHLAGLLRALGLVRYDLIARRTSRYPDDASVRDGELVFVVDGGVEKWACFRCPGGCGALIPLSLNPRRRPRWSVALDWLHRPTVRPSVHQTNDCACHFHVNGGRVDWCEGGRPLGRGART
ncbi:UNVERIFIED_CONTAM: DUF6527 family protein [Methylobacteriaceae bacterium AG10]|uniref:DUF6527 family protein n=1 Tax=Methylobacterium sp. Leaf118 TaxID=2876562 RepID=UPI001E3C31F9|nr:DUF6527 family protein [Methylobacterium sp. Leaf118]MDV2985118.1 DUF6527 family protein [Methylobacteriaceae bacterium AG10]